MPKYDAIVIGSGPAGISCAVYLRRYNHNVLVIGKDEGSLAKAHKIENYYGIKSISGKDLVEQGIKQAKHLGIEVLKEEVIDIELFDSYKVRTDKNEYEANAIVLALGTTRNTFNLAKDYEGKGVSYCATCDGFFYRKKRVALIGSGQFMLNEYNVLSNMISDITVFTNGENLSVKLNDDTNVVTDKILAFTGEDKLEGIKTENKTYDIDGAFIAMGSQSAFTLAKHLGIGLNGAVIAVNSEYMTNIKGVYAIGDCIGGLLQVAKAVSDGANSAIYITKYLKNFDK